MGDITRNISRGEMACLCGCGFNACDKVLMESLQLIVDHFSIIYDEEGRVTITISGPNRCLLHNEKIQVEYHTSRGEIYKPYSSHSKHMCGIAADFTLYVHRSDGRRTMIPAVEVFSYMDNTWPDTFGMGIYNNRCHLDVRSDKRRWNG